MGRQGTCVYCGRVGEVTREHVPPRAFFKVLPPNLRRVPSCWDCNNSSSKDDEYFRTVATLKHGISEHPVARELSVDVMRALGRSGGLRELVMGTLGPVEVRTPAGLVLGTQYGFQVDWERLRRTVEKITRGLFFRELGRSLPPDCELSVLTHSQIANLDEENQSTLIHALEQQKAKARVLGKDVLAYLWAVTHDEADATVWFLRFYGSLWFMVFTWPVGLAPPVSCAPKSQD